MPGRLNLPAIPSLAAAAFAAPVYRVVPAGLRDKILSTEGNRHYPGRYHAAGETGILYASLERETALREIGRHASRAALQGDLAAGRIKVKLQKTLDLTKPAILSALGLSKDDLVSSDLSMTQAISLQARDAGFQGLLVPSATGAGVNLVVFENDLGEDCLIEVEEISAIEVD